MKHAPVFLFCLLLVPLPVLPARAQMPAAPPKTLADALASVAWNPAARGALLVVDPAAVKPVPERGMPTAGRDGYPAKALAEGFGQQEKRFGSVTVLAPTERVELNPNPGPPNLLAGLKRSELLRLLMNSLTAAQWKTAGGPSGLGLSDLAEKQRPIFAAMLPDPFVYVQTTTHFIGRKDDPAKVHRLSDSEREAVHLRFVLQTDVSAERLHPDTTGSARMDELMRWSSVVFDRNAGQDGREFLDLVDDDQSAPIPNPFGVALSAQVANREKPGQLNFAALTRPVSLDGAATVGELVRRIGQANQMELYADPHLARLPLWTRGLSAFGGDALRALCRCVGGAVRQVGPAYVLTDDMAGWGARRAVLTDWMRDAGRAKSKLLNEYDGTLGKTNPGQWLTWSADEPVKLSPEQLQKVRANPFRATFPLSALTPPQQAFIRDAAAKKAQMADGKFAVNPETLRVSVRSYLAFALPDGAQIVSDFGPDISELTPRPDTAAPEKPIPTLDSLPHRTLIVTARDAKTAKQAVALAQKRGFERLWLDAGDGGEAVLKAALTAAKPFKLPVGAVISLRATPEKTPEADLNISGEPTKNYLARREKTPAVNWLAPGSGAWGGREERLSDLARLPGLSALVLRDWAAPGFRPSPERPAVPFDGAASEVGYTLPQRLAFLRHAGVDPIDIVPYWDYVQYDLPPYFDDGTTDPRAAAWRAWRADENRAAMASLYRRLLAARPALPLLLLAAPLGNDFSDAFVGTWDAPEKLPSPRFRFPGDAATVGKAAAAHSTSKLAWFRVNGSWTASDARYTFPEHVRDVMGAAGAGWEGIVFDFGGLSLDEAAKRLESLPREKGR